MVNIWLMMVTNDLVGGKNLPISGVYILLIYMVNDDGYYMVNDG